MSRQIKTSGRSELSAEQNAALQRNGKLLFTTYHGQRAAFLLRDNRLYGAFFFPPVQSKIGAIYIGRVKNVIPNLNAYFVEIGGEEREICFLSQKDAAHPFLLNRTYDGRILEGDEFPVQVTRDAVKTKQASVTTALSVSSPYFALSVGEARTGYSGKLTPAQKERLQQLLQSSANEFQGRQKDVPAGLVVRTRAAELADSPEQLLAELSELMGRWENLFHAALHRTCFACLTDAPAPWEASLDQLAYPYEYEEILTDDMEIYGQLKASERIPSDKAVRFYDEKENGDFSLTKLYRLESKMKAALERRVWLRSGGYLVIDPTEALTVIDVNSGKCESGRDPEKTYYQINLEAAEEIVLQLRLRNLSGMIVVDFINMKSQEHQNDLLEYLRQRVRADKQKTAVVDMTQLGLVEITRKKGMKPLAEQIEGQREDATSGSAAWD